jgi:hypothetical protein
MKRAGSQAAAMFALSGMAVRVVLSPMVRVVMVSS